MCMSRSLFVFAPRMVEMRKHVIACHTVSGGGLPRRFRHENGAAHHFPDWKEEERRNAPDLPAFFQQQQQWEYEKCCSFVKHASRRWYGFPLFLEGEDKGKKGRIKSPFPRLANAADWWFICLLFRKTIRYTTCENKHWKGQLFSNIANSHRLSKQCSHNCKLSGDRYNLFNLFSLPGNAFTRNGGCKKEKNLNTKTCEYSPSSRHKGRANDAKSEEEESEPPAGKRPE